MLPRPPEILPVADYLLDPSESIADFACYARIDISPVEGRNNNFAIVNLSLIALSCRLRCVNRTFPRIENLVTRASQSGLDFVEKPFGRPRETVRRS